MVALYNLPRIFTATSSGGEHLLSFVLQMWLCNVGKLSGKQQKSKS